jgi:hypothetical protein
MSDQTESAAVEVDESTTYGVGGSTRVSLSVTYGDAGMGGTSVIFDESVTDVAQGETVSFSRNGASLVGGVLSCSSNLKAAVQTVHTSVTYHLSGGGAPQSFLFQQNAGEPGGEVTYFVNIVLV